MRKSLLALLFGMLLVIGPITFPQGGIYAAKSITVGRLSCEHLSNPMGIGTTKPRFSWILYSGETDQVQTAFQVLVASSPELLSEKNTDLWNSGKTESDRSVLVEYGGVPLSARDRCWWKVRVWDKNGKVSPWSETAYFEIGLSGPGDWQAFWITSDISFDPGDHPGRMLRKEFSICKKVESARLYISSLGLYQAEINGKKVGDLVLTPGWTSYHNRVQYQTYDITGMLWEGGNAIGITLGDGWYRDFRQTGFDAEQGKSPSLDLIAQLEIFFTDGTSERIVTDDTWKSSTGPILASTIYNGETYDARLEKEGWSKAGFDDSDWSGTMQVDHPGVKLVSPDFPPMRRIDEIELVKIIVTPEGDTVADMGQNMVGWIRLEVNAPAGTKVTLRHSEVLDREGNFYTENLRKAAQTNTYICRGGGKEIWEPKFTFQGFRYVSVSGLPGELTPDMLTGVVVHSDLEPTGSFKCNNELVNQLQHNIVWGQKGNFVDVPTDCPQRDERLGWTGDAQVFASTACFNLNCAGFYIKWLKDLALDQHQDGAVPWVIPNVLGRGEGVHGWADAATIVPWTVYRYYGDLKVLRQQYPSMKAWVDYVIAQTGDSFLWVPRGRHFGDWLAFATTRPDYPGATTDKDLLATAYFYHSTDLLQRSAELLGKQAEAARYRTLMGKIKEAFIREYLTPGGRLSSNTQTAYVVALSFGLIPEGLEEAAAKRLALDVRSFGHLTTGFLGTPDLCHVLTEFGYLEEAYMLLFRQEYPSWLYPITRGATTIWERWDGQRPDGSFQDPDMNSFNHYAYGAIGDWLYRKVAGIELDPEVPGFKAIIIKPHPGGRMNDVDAFYNCFYGTIRSQWKREKGRFRMTVSVPVNSRARIHIPATGPELIIDGKPADAARQVDGPGYSYFIVEKGSGTWSFETPFDKHGEMQP